MFKLSGISALAAINYPKLFEALVLVDPVILVPKADIRDFVEPLVVGAVQRREEWPSLQVESHLAPVLC